MSDVEIKIDGKKYTATLGENLVIACKKIGLYIPTLCYLENHECLGTCRICTIKINGRTTAACSNLVSAGMELEINTPEMQDLRKAIVELIFVEGNHFCPSCEKSGNCQLQAVAYAMEMHVSRFPYPFAPYHVHYEGERIILEHNRCIHCKRCTNLFRDEQGYKVFSFVKRGRKTRVLLDLEREKLLPEHKINESVNLCPVGAILTRGRNFSKPIGRRQYDLQPIGIIPKDYLENKSKGDKSNE